MYSKKEFKRVWKDTTREGILNQFYYEHKEIGRLNDIINELEEYMKKEWENKDYGAEYRIALAKVYNVLQELKENK